MPTNTNISDLLKRLARGLLSRRAVWVYWIVNITLLAGLILWICCDGLFPRSALVTSQAASWEDTFFRSDPMAYYLTTRVHILQAIIAAAFLSGMGILAALFAGTESNRSMRAWLAVMFALAAWLTIYTSWSGLAFQAQAWRISKNLSELDTLASTLLEAWPNEDGQLPEIGPFTAYPIGHPRSLRLLKKTIVPGTDIQIAMINRLGDSALQFILVGNEAEASLIYTAEGNAPQVKSTGWVNAEIRSIRQEALGNHWTLIQYRIVPILK